MNSASSTADIVKMQKFGGDSFGESDDAHPQVHRRTKPSAAICDIESMNRVTQSVKESLKNKYSAKKLTKLTGSDRFAPALSTVGTGAQRHQFPRTMRGTAYQGGFADRRCTDLESAPVSDHGKEFVGSYSASTTPTNFGRKR